MQDMNYIEFLLERELPIPQPSVLLSISTSTGITNSKLIMPQNELTIDDILDSQFVEKVIEKDDRELLV